MNLRSKVTLRGIFNWYDKVRHLGTFFSCNINDSTGVTHKRSYFIGYFNKLMSKFAFIQPVILSICVKHYPMDFINTVYSGINM